MPKAKRRSVQQKAKDKRNYDSGRKTSDTSKQDKKSRMKEILMKKRLDEKFRKTEAVDNKKRMQKMRKPVKRDINKTEQRDNTEGDEDSPDKEKENISETVVDTVSAENDYSTCERPKNRQRIKRTRTENPSSMQREREINANRIKIRRLQDPRFAQRQREAAAKSMKTSRAKDPISNNRQRVANAKRMQITRARDLISRQRQREANMRRMRITRAKDPISRQRQRVVNAKRMQISRAQDPSSRQRQREANAKGMKIKRAEDPIFTQRERDKNKNRIKEIRSDHQKSQIENQKNIQRMQDLRDNDAYRKEERERDRLAKRIQRGSEILCHRNLVYNYLKQHELEEKSSALLRFFQSRKQVPAFVCACCERVFFETGVVKITREKVLSRMSSKLNADISRAALCVNGHILNNYNDSHQNYLCHTCYKYVGEGKIPKLSSNNGLKLPPVPECLKVLNDIEERLLSPYVPFMKILLLNHRASNPQIGAKGSVIYIPVDVNEMEKSLPRNFNNLNMLAVPVDFKRHMGHSTSYLKGFVRQKELTEAGQYLQKTELYQKYGISFTENSMDELMMITEEVDEKVIDDNLVVPETNMNIDDEFYNQLHDGDDECLLFDLNDIAAINTVVVMAPGQNQKPVSPYSNPDIEFLSFPKIFAGQPRRLTDKNITLNDTIKWEIRYHQNKIEPRRVLYLSKVKLFNESFNSIKNAIRKKKNSKNITAQQALAPNFIDGLLPFNSGLRFMNQLRCAPAYMEQKKKVLFALVGQIGPPVFFLTVSAVETNWPELIQGLKEYSTGEKISLLEALNLPYEERAKLVNDNPVFTAMYYENKIKNLMKTINSTSSVFEEYKVTDFFRRREFQQRGSPHDHILLWMENAPRIDPDDPSTFDTVIEFADKFITCKYDESNPFCKYLRHKHTATCSKGKTNKNICRFNFPKFVMPATMILEPLPKEENTVEVKKNLTSIKSMMEQFFTSKERIFKNFDEILSDLGMTMDTYLKAIRSSISKFSIFYERRSCEVDINTYNMTILNLMESNVDLQLVLDEYGVAAYIVDYIAKGEAGLSKGLKDLQTELDKENRNLKERMRCIMNKFLNGHIMSTSEAVYHCLGTSITEFSRASIFINTSPSDERVVFLKSTKELQALEPDSMDIAGKDIITHYSERNGLDDICLTEYAGYYFSTANKPRKDKNLDSDDEQNNPDEDVIDYEHSRRKKARIIRYVRYKLGQDPENYYREQLLLFLPWRNEEKEIVSVNWYDKYLENIAQIEQNRCKMFKLSSDKLEDAIRAANERREMDDAEEVEEFEANPIPKDQEIDILIQAGIDRPKNNVPFIYTAPTKTNKANLLEILSKLNARQLEIVMHVYKCFTTGKLPLRIFISGSAGVGKSMVISTIYQLITYHLEYSPTVLKDQSTDSIKVLLCAFSGKAAFLIGGNTLHSAFALPLQENSKMSDLPMDVANNLRQQLFNCKLVIIDEISMVGSTIFSRIDTRLRQITGVSNSFGGLSLICVGDFLQLSPVKDSAIFCPPKHSLLKTNLSPLWDEFYLYELTEVMRQKDDLNFVRALNNFARGEMTDDDIIIIKSREVEDLQVPNEAIRLYYTNADVEKYNNKKIDESPSPEIECNAVDTITGKLKPQQKTQKMKMWKERPTKDCGGYPYTLRLKQGIKYMVTANLDVSDGLVNGATGVLKHVYCSPGTDKPRIVFLNFDSSNVGKKIRQQYKNFMENNNLNIKWTPIPRKSYNLTTHFQKDYQMIRDQFPLVPCEALTIHKSQGQTYENVCLDFRKSGNLTRQLVYVALSRVTKLSGLYIQGSFPGNMKSNNTIDASLNEMDRLRSQRRLSLVYDNLENTEGLILAYLNIRSLRANLQYITLDKWYSRCDILIFSETCMYIDEEVEILGFRLVYRSDAIKYPEYVKKNIAKGIMCFAKSNLELNIVKSFTAFKSDKNGNYQSHVDLVHIMHNGITFIGGYKSPKASIDDFKDGMAGLQIVDTVPIIVVGDFNFNLNDSTNAQVRQFQLLMSSMRLKDNLPNEGTTLLGSRLDVLFTNIDNLKTGIYECYFSDHKPVFSIIPSGPNISKEHNTLGSVHELASDSIDSGGDAMSDLQNIVCMSVQCSDSDLFIDCSGVNDELAKWMESQSRLDANNEPVTFSNGSLIDHVNKSIFGYLQLHKYWDDFCKDYIKNQFKTYDRCCEVTCQHFNNLPPIIFDPARDTLFSEQIIENFREIPITGNGDCQFNSISYALTGSEGFAGDLRVLAIRSIIDNETFFSCMSASGFLESETLPNLLCICCQNGEWGNQDTLFALSLILQRCIYFIEKFEASYRTYVVTPYVISASPIILRLHNAGSGNAHYNVMLPIRANVSCEFENTENYNLTTMFANFRGE